MLLTFPAYVCVVSVALRLPAAYRCGTGSNKGRKEDGGFKRLGGARDVGGMSLGENKNYSSD